MNELSLGAFVVAAHRNGYATESPESDGAAKVIEYREGDWRYVDRYYGSRSFVSSEVVLSDGTSVWWMDYDGTSVWWMHNDGTSVWWMHNDGTSVWRMHYDWAPPGEDVDHERVYAFFRVVLARASPEHPFRGPERVTGDRFSYHAETDGDLMRFRGTELIERDGEVVYRGQYGGGNVQ